MTGPRSWWGWGRSDAALGQAELDGLGALLAERFERPPAAPSVPVDPRRVALPAPRTRTPGALAAVVSEDPVDRLRHGHGNAFRDVARAVHGEVPHVPDAVVRPRSEDEVAAVLEWCTQAGIACVPFGGGTSVVGGVTPPPTPAVSLDLECLGGVASLDPVSGLARVGAGTDGPRLEEELRPQGLTFRHFPQSWEFSTVGGWIATRSAGHFATGPTRVDDLVAAVTAVTPTGVWRSRRLPSSGAGPSPDRLLLGSEGILGVVTEAWLRVQPRPGSRGSATLCFDRFEDGLSAVRAITQDGLRPANCRLLDPTEAALSGAEAPGSPASLLLLGFEAPEGPVDAPVARAVELARDHGARVVDGPSFRLGDRAQAPADGSGAWRETFLRAPYVRDALVRLGAVVETFETATTWDRAADLVADLRTAAQGAATEVCGGALVAVRTTHAYPDGVAPYVTVVAPGPPGELEGPALGRAQVAAWDEVKVAVSEVLDAAGATVTHHHAVGRDHRPWYDRQRPEPFARALAAAKAAVDPAGVLNPGVLVGPVQHGHDDGAATTRPGGTTP